MELDIGMSCEGLRKLANDILLECDRRGSRNIEVVRRVEANDSGPELRLAFTNDDMEDRDDVSEGTAYWELRS